MTNFALGLGISRSAPVGWKKGKLPNDTTLVKIADYFGVTKEALLYGGGGVPASPVVSRSSASDGDALKNYKNIVEAQNKLLDTHIRTIESLRSEVESLRLENASLKSHGEAAAIGRRRAG